MINVMSPSSIITHLQSLPLSEWTGNLNLNLNLDYLLNFIEQAWVFWLQSEIIWDDIST